MNPSLAVGRARARLDSMRSAIIATNADPTIQFNPDPTVQFPPINMEPPFASYEEAAEMARALADQAVATLPIPVPEMPQAVVKEVDLAEYGDLARSLRYRHGAEVNVDEALRRFLVKNEIPIYRTKSVTEYLVAIREHVVQHHPGASGRHYKCTVDSTSIEQYSQLIPIEVLRTAKAIQDGAGMELEFSVLSLSVHPDPFLAVRAGGGQLTFIVAHWDEPGFTLDPRKNKTTEDSDATAD